MELTRVGCGSPHAPFGMKILTASFQPERARPFLLNRKDLGEFGQGNLRPPGITEPEAAIGSLPSRMPVTIRSHESGTGECARRSGGGDEIVTDWPAT
jgi:hypothetical protein